MRSISVFKNAKETKPASTTFLSIITDDILTGVYKNQIEALRKEQDKKARTQIKLSLPAFTVSGEFIQRKKEGLKQHSHFYILDFDKVQDVEGLKKLLMSYDGVTCAFRSPSGNGVKAVLGAVRHTGEDAETKHSIVWKYINETFGALEGFDQSGKDVCRLCFYSYDDKLLENKRATIDLTEYKPKAKQPVKLEGIFQDDNHYVLKRAVDMINGAADGEKHHVLLKASNLVGGYVASGEVSFNTALDVLSSAISSRGIDNERQAQKTITDGLNNGTNSPLQTDTRYQQARQQTNGTHKPLAAQGATVEQEAKPQDIKSLLESVEFDAGNVPDEDDTLVYLGGAEIGSKGNIMAITGMAKSRKTVLTSAMMAASLKGSEVLNFSTDLSEDDIIIHFDTEQGYKHYYNVVNRVLNQSQVEYDSKRFKSFHTRKFTIEQRRKASRT